MYYFKKRQSRKLQQNFRGISRQFFASILVLVFFATLPLRAHQNVNDCFYLPELNNSINLNGSRDGNEWQGANWFTFGTIGYFEVEVYGFHGNDSLYLAFRINDSSNDGRDNLIICIDPENLGDPDSTNPNSLKQYIVFRTGTTLYSIRTDTSNTYTPVSPSTSGCTNAVNEESTFWEIEIKIDYIVLDNNFDENNFGLCFQVIDFNGLNSEFTRYIWPISANNLNNFPHFMVPLANDWANGKCVPTGQWASQAKPDIYFHKDHVLDLKTGDTVNDLTLICSGPNSVSTKLFNHFSDGSSNSISLEFCYADYGLSCWGQIGNTTPLTMTTESYLEPNVNDPGQLPDCSNSDPILVNLQAEHSCTNDAITSNNVVVRSIAYVDVEGGDTFDTPIEIAYCENDAGDALYYDDKKSKFIAPIQLASSMMFPFQRERTDRRETFYIYVDRSGLDTTDLEKGYWDIDFTPGAPEDTLLPKPVPDQEDLYTLELQPGDTAGFQMEVVAPVYETNGWSGCCLLNPSGCLTSGGPSQRHSSVEAFPMDVKRTSSQESRQQIPKDITMSAYQSGARLSTLKVKVYKEKQAYTYNDTTYHQMETLGYFGTIIKVKPRTKYFWDYVRISFHGGYTKPYNEWYEDALHYNIILDLEFRPKKAWGFDVEVGYNDFKLIDNDKHFPWWNISGTVRYYFGVLMGNFQPLINIGPGLYIPDEGDMRLGAKFGLGIDYILTDRIMFEMGIDYHNIFPAKEKRQDQDKRTSFQHYHGGIIFRLK